MSIPKAVYCGINDVPKGKKRGSMRDCAKIGQVRYYGLYKIDKKTATLDRQDALKYRKLKAVLLKNYGSYSGKIARLKKDIPYIKDENKKIEAKKLLNDLILKYNSTVNELKKLQESGKLY
jgi:hypothetical protein